MQIKAEKSALRKKYSAIRADEKSEDKDYRICNSFIGSEAYKSSDTVFIYYSVRAEADTLKIINTALADGKKVALPKCTDTGGNMNFYFIDDVSKSLIDGYFGLKEPDPFFCKKAFLGNKDVCVVPAVAADKRGCRLGYGGGYYDRFLSKFKGRTVALCYEECICDELPCDDYDVKIDIIITDRKIYVTK